MRSSSEQVVAMPAKGRTIALRHFGRRAELIGEADRGPGVSQRVIVVGATGTIGRPLCNVLIEHGHGLVVFSRDPARAVEAVLPGALHYLLSAPSPTGHRRP
jgi:NADPH:quinone reductase-like Zn-dependent oxidoreductase